MNGSWPQTPREALRSGASITAGSAVAGAVVTVLIVAWVADQQITAAVPGPLRRGLHDWLPHAVHVTLREYTPVRVATLPAALVAIVGVRFVVAVPVVRWWYGRTATAGANQPSLGWVLAARVFATLAYPLVAAIVLVGYLPLATVLQALGYSLGLSTATLTTAFTLGLAWATVLAWGATGWIAHRLDHATGQSVTERIRSVARSPPADADRWWASLGQFAGIALLPFGAATVVAAGFDALDGGDTTAVVGFLVTFALLAAVVHAVRPAVASPTAVGVHADRSRQPARTPAGDTSTTGSVLVAGILVSALFVGAVGVRVADVGPRDTTTPPGPIDDPDPGDVFAAVDHLDWASHRVTVRRYDRSANRTLRRVARWAVDAADWERRRVVLDQGPGGVRASGRYESLIVAGGGSDQFPGNLTRMEGESTDPWTLLPPDRITSSFPANGSAPYRGLAPPDTLLANVSETADDDWRATGLNGSRTLYQVRDESVVRRVVDNATVSSGFLNVVLDNETGRLQSFRVRWIDTTPRIPVNYEIVGTVSGYGETTVDRPDGVETGSFGIVYDIVYY